MLDMKWIREHADEVQQTADRKGISLSVKELLERDKNRRAELAELERLRQNRNRLTEEIRAAMQRDGQAKSDLLRAEIADNKRRIQETEIAYSQADSEFKRLLLLVPNIVSQDTPVGVSDADNVKVRSWGLPPEFGFELRDHVELGRMLGILDTQRGVKVAGSRNYYLKGDGFRLQRAVQQLALDVLERKGFDFLEVPLMVGREAMVNTGFFPLGEDQTYPIAGEERWLVGTSEVPLIGYFSGDLVDLSQGPVKAASASVCFRSEVGSAGRDTSGLYRVHQFSKVEQVVICRNDPALSEALLQEITANAEEILQLLELPYQVMAVCTGDMSQKTYKQFDIETWMPSRGSYGETHSSSNLQDFQARRSNIRYREEDGCLQFCHTLNNTAVATPRILIPLLENHQREDGSVYIPLALRPYMGGREVLNPSRQP
ncbi:serine--tRNA ligase [Paenibacillus physcomitrellae]|uniref:Serine--tRNA ligase n=1 Tax=Paenibacillus physcomitrellae TaxID=1619311 RepID=A0ABQ1GIT1_9BACL|nr:serine--tRNA ligase [Paenibacillus physcomitrellae]GGA44719.1 serine--tRNA ligase [Paenibacillus physcomitrellae]